MKAGNYYYITALPTLGNLGDAPPITPGEVLNYFLENPPARALASALFLLDDLLQREAYLGGEIKTVEPIVLSDRQIKNEEPLPSYLVSDEIKTGRSIRADGLWESYFRYATGVAVEIGSRFLKEWVGFEVTLRNTLAAARAKRLGLEAEPYLVASDLEETSEDLSGVIREWASAPNPLAGHKILTLARWQWLAGHDAWFSFENDELAAYAARLMLLHEWHRLIAAGAEKSNAGDSQ
jgi:hypothetical protein